MKRREGRKFVIIIIIQILVCCWAHHFYFLRFFVHFIFSFCVCVCVCLSSTHFLLTLCTLQTIFTFLLHLLYKSPIHKAIEDHVRYIQISTQNILLSFDFTKEMWNGRKWRNSIKRKSGPKTKNWNAIVVLMCLWWFIRELTKKTKKNTKMCRSLLDCAHQVLRCVETNSIEKTNIHNGTHNKL